VLLDFRNTFQPCIEKYIVYVVLKCRNAKLKIKGITKQKLRKSQISLNRLKIYSDSDFVCMLVLHISMTCENFKSLMEHLKKF